MAIKVNAGTVAVGVSGVLVGVLLGVVIIAQINISAQNHIALSQEAAMQKLAEAADYELRRQEALDKTIENVDCYLDPVTLECDYNY